MNTTPTMTLAQAFKAQGVYGETPHAIRFVRSYRYWRQHGADPLKAHILAQTDVNAGRERYPHSPKHDVLGAPWKSGSSTLRWAESPEQVGLVTRRFCDEVERGIDHTGWFLDNDGCGDKARGEVFTLPHRRGYIAGVADPCNDGPACLDLTTIFDTDDERGAAYHADSLAEVYAENERDYRAASNAWFRWSEELPERIKEIRREALALFKEIRAIRPSLCGNENIIAILREKVESAVERIAKLRRKRDKLESEYGNEKGWRDNIVTA